jgi:hypothetical protein
MQTMLLFHSRHKSCGGSARHGDYVMPALHTVPTNALRMFWMVRPKPFFSRVGTEHTYLLTPWCRVLEKLTGSQVFKKPPAFHGTLRFIPTITSACHPSLSWSRSIPSMLPHPTSWRSFLILSSHLRLDLTNGLFPSVLPPLLYPILLHAPPT